MGYLVGSGIIDPAIKRYDGGGSSFTMDNSGTTNGTLLWVGGVAQVPGTDYNVSGTTISTTTAAPSGTNNVVSLQLFNTGLITTPADNTVTTAKIQTNAIDGTLTKDALIADYSDVTITAADLLMYGDATDSNNTKRDTVQGVLDLVPSAGFTISSEQATTSGTSVTFGSIPAGTKLIFVMLAGVSTNATTGLGVQLGDAGGLETSGYAGRSAYENGGVQVVNFSDHFEITVGNAADVINATFILTLQDSSNFAWNVSLTTASTGQTVWTGAGTKTLSAELTQVAVISDGTMDLGVASIMYI